MNEYRAVVVGAGGISDAWFGPLKKEDVQVTGVVDLDLDRARGQIAKYELDCPASTSLRSTLRKSRPDFVVDLTVPEAHCAVTCTALRFGCHVIGEKPMAATMAQARKMVRAAEKADRLYMVSQSRRWYARHGVIVRAIAAGTIGTVTTINCDFYIGAHFGGFRDQMQSPLILDMAIHHFDLARLLAGSDPLAVYARQFNPAGSWYAGDAAASCLFEMTNNVMFTYRGSWCSEGCHTSWNGNWRIVGTMGSILYENDQPAVAQVVAGDSGFHRPLRTADLPAPALSHEKMHGALREMLEFLRTGRRPQTECHDNIRSLAMVFAAIESSRKQRRVRVGS